MRITDFYILHITVCVLLMASCTNPTSKPPPSVSQTLQTEVKQESTIESIDYEGFTPKMAGVNFVAPPEPFRGAVMSEVKSVNANWIAPIPYAFCRQGEASVHYGGGGGRWWGESPEGVRVTIDSAHRVGIKVMLKPQVYVPGGWPGSVDFTKDTDWEKWEKDYTKYIMRFVDIAVEMKTEAFCIGTEFKISTQKRPVFWRDLIDKIRQKYTGQLTYASTWDDYMVVPFWDALDFVGIDMYIPLLEKDTPSVSELCEAWKPHFEAVKAFQAKTKKNVVFTEYGYMSVDGTAWRGWEIEKKVTSLKINELAQANAIEALHRTFSRAAWWKGGFIWKWFPDGQGHEGYFERDYTPQGKLSAAILRKWHGLYK